jgi:hypothetical protein
MLNANENPSPTTVYQKLARRLIQPAKLCFLAGSTRLCAGPITSLAAGVTAQMTTSLSSWQGISFVATSEIFSYASDKIFERFISPSYIDTTSCKVVRMALSTLAGLAASTALYSANQISISPYEATTFAMSSSFLGAASLNLAGTMLGRR